MRCAEKIVSGPVAVVAAGVGVLPLRRSSTLLKIHFVATVPAEQQPGKQIDFIGLGRPVSGGNALSSKGKGFFVNQRFVGVGEPCVDEKDTSKKCENKVIQCGRKDGVVTNKARKSWVFQNDLSFQKFYAPEMQNPPFADGVNSLSTNPRAAGLCRQPWGIYFFRHCYICFVCLSLFVGSGNSFRHAFRVYLRCNQRKGE